MAQTPTTADTGTPPPSHDGARDVPLLDTEAAPPPKRAEHLEVEGDAKAEDGRWRCLTTEAKTLGLTALLFATITVCQLFGAWAADSHALMVDCISMGVDAGTMVGNLFAEVSKHSRWHRAIELAVGAVSLLTLAFFTLRELLESISILRAGSGEGEADEVDPYIVMGFAIGGLIFDLISLYAFRRSHKKNMSGREMNMWTALMHVGADFLRSITTLALSFAILLRRRESARLDASASLFVGATILSGAAVGIASWCKALATGAPAA
mmetsp:Transcript_96049/g.268854  ORF Transcript_96049/g.268854 Transcript_96049/m.268854 type:complete len:267 (+) Transcript_96049:90-890(+)